MFEPGDTLDFVPSCVVEFFDVPVDPIRDEILASRLFFFPLPNVSFCAGVIVVASRYATILIDRKNSS